MTSYNFRGDRPEDDAAAAIWRRIEQHLANHNRKGTHDLNQRERHQRQDNQWRRGTNIRLYELEKKVDELAEKVDNLTEKNNFLVDAFNDFLSTIWIFLDHLSTDIKTLLERTEPPQTDPDVLVIPRDESHFTQEVDEG